jgi:hypothetical protein
LCFRKLRMEHRNQGTGHRLITMVASEAGTMSEPLPKIGDCRKGYVSTYTSVRNSLEIDEHAFNASNYLSSLRIIGACSGN